MGARVNVNGLKNHFNFIEMGEGGFSNPPTPPTPKCSPPSCTPYPIPLTFLPDASLVDFLLLFRGLCQAGSNETVSFRCFHEEILHPPLPHRPFRNDEWHNCFSRDSLCWRLLQLLAVRLFGHHVCGRNQLHRIWRCGRKWKLCHLCTWQYDGDYCAWIRHVQFRSTTTSCA